MKIRFLFMGKTDEKWLSESFGKYSKRISNYVGLQIDVIPDVKRSGKISIEKQKEEEGQLFLKHLSENEEVVLLDEAGEQWSSVEFSNLLQRKMNSGIKTLTFIVGGPYGFSDEIYKKYKQRLSFSKMTFSHQMIRLILAEQIYRAFTILKNEPYHHQ